MNVCTSSKLGFKSLLDVELSIQVSDFTLGEHMVPVSIFLILAVDYMALKLSYRCQYYALENSKIIGALMKVASYFAESGRSLNKEQFKIPGV